VLRFQSGLELLFGEAIPANVAPACYEKSSKERSRIFMRHGYRILRAQGPEKTRGSALNKVETSSLCRLTPEKYTEIVTSVILLGVPSHVSSHKEG
jgi:hypothetical protein